MWDCGPQEWAAQGQGHLNSFWASGLGQPSTKSHVAEFTFSPVASATSSPFLLSVFAVAALKRLLRWVPVIPYALLADNQGDDW